MQTSSRSVPGAADAGLASPELVEATSSSALADAASVTGRPTTELIRRSMEANAALMRGEIDRYRALITLADDFTLMAPFGGTPTHGSDMTGERWEATGRFFRNGTFAQEVVRSYATADMVVLATIERSRVEVGGLPAQDWALRVTLVYCREGSEWRLAHRHADPLVAGISLERAAALARANAPISLHGSAGASAHR